MTNKKSTNDNYIMILLKIFIKKNIITIIKNSNSNNNNNN